MHIIRHFRVGFIFPRVHCLTYVWVRIFESKLSLFTSVNDKRSFTTFLRSFPNCTTFSLHRYVQLRIVHVHTQRQLFPPWHVSSTACSIQNMWKGIYDDDDDYIDKSLYIYWINCQKQEACDDRKPKRVWHWFFWTALLALLSKARLLCIHPPLLTIYFLFHSLFSPLLTNYNSTASSRSLPVISTHTHKLYTITFYLNCHRQIFCIQNSNLKLYMSSFEPEENYHQTGGYCF